MASAMSIDRLAKFDVSGVDFHVSSLGAALLKSDLSRTLLLVLGFGACVGVFQLWRTWYRLRHIPGPFPACITNFHRMYWVTTWRHHLILQQLHDKYGELVRIGPNTVSFRSCEAISTVYPMRPGFPKSKFYETLKPYTPSGGELPAVFNTQDEAQHKQIKTPIAPLFSASQMAQTEGLVNDVLLIVKKQFDEKFSTTGEVFDLGQWLQFFAFDVMGTMTFSKRYGFTEQGKDVGGMLDSIKKYMKEAAPFTQINWLDKLLRKNRYAHRITQYLLSSVSLGIMGFIAKAIEEKRQKIAEGKNDPAAELHGRTDFLTRFIEIEQENESVPKWAPTAWTFSNVMAGSDSVGTVARTTLFNLLSYPHTYEKLRQELFSANLAKPLPDYAEVRDLPYLDACVHEGSRMHPPFSLNLERVVPAGGVTVLGQYLPEGSVIGGSPYVVNRDKATFGDDADFWRPERWIEGDDAHKRKLEQGNLTFGAGRRVCLGKEIGRFEIKKMIAFLVLNYDMRVVDREKFETSNTWFFVQKNFFAQIEKRAENQADESVES